MIKKHKNEILLYIFKKFLEKNTFDLIQYYLIRLNYCGFLTPYIILYLYLICFCLFSTLELKICPRQYFLKKCIETIRNIFAY
jgi:hypothetical protein